MQTSRNCRRLTLIWISFHLVIIFCSFFFIRVLTRILYNAIFTLINFHSHVIIALPFTHTAFATNTIYRILSYIFVNLFIENSEWWRRIIFIFDIQFNVKKNPIILMLRLKLIILFWQIFFRHFILPLYNRLIFPFIFFFSVARTLCFLSLQLKLVIRETR